MRNLIILFLAIGLAFSGCKPQPQQPRDDGAITPPPDDAAQLVQDADIPVHDASVYDAAAYVQDASRAGASPELVNYLASSMAFWRKDRDGVQRQLAAAIAEVVETEMTVFPTTDDGLHAETGILLATVAFFESGFASYVVDCRCNDAAWRATQEGKRLMFSGGDCDGGLAVSAWQIHLEFGGIILTPDGGWRWKNYGETAAISSQEMRDEETAARVALHMLRESLQRTGGLSGYTGESGGAPKAKARLDFARNWWQHHPL